MEKYYERPEFTMRPSRGDTLVVVQEPYEGWFFYKVNKDTTWSDFTFGEYKEWRKANNYSMEDLVHLMLVID